MSAAVPFARVEESRISFPDLPAVVKASIYNQVLRPILYFHDYADPIGPVCINRFKIRAVCRGLYTDTQNWSLVARLVAGYNSSLLNTQQLITPAQMANIIDLKIFTSDFVPDSYDDFAAYYRAVIVFSPQAFGTQFPKLEVFSIVGRNATAVQAVADKYLAAHPNLSASVASIVDYGRTMIEMR